MNKPHRRQTDKQTNKRSARRHVRTHGTRHVNKRQTTVSEQEAQVHRRRTVNNTACLLVRRPSRAKDQRGGTSSRGQRSLIECRETEGPSCIATSAGRNSRSSAPPTPFASTIHAPRMTRRAGALHRHVVRPHILHGPQEPSEDPGVDVPRLRQAPLAEERHEDFTLPDCRARGHKDSAWHPA